MGREIFRPAEGIIRVDLTVIGIKRGSFRTIVAALDTGAATTSIPLSVASDLGYDLDNAEEIEIVTGSRVETVKIIKVREVRAVGESISNIEVLCHDLPEGSAVEGLLGANFLSDFDVNISYPRGIVEIKRPEYLR